LKEGGTPSQAGLNLVRRNRFRAVLVAVEVAFSLVLLVGAGLLLNSFLRVSFMDPGFKPQNLLAGAPRIDPSRFQRASAGEMQIGTQYTELLDRVRALPGVTGAALATFAPPQKATMELGVVAEGQYYSEAEEAPKAPVVHVTPGYFQAMAVPLRQGRLFERLDVENQGVVILSELAARRFLPRQEPIGQLLFLGDDVAEVIGVVSNVRQAGLDQDLQPLMYLPTDSGMIERTTTRTSGGRRETAKIRMIRQMQLLVRAEGDPLAQAGPLVAEVEAAGMTLPELQTMDQTLWQSMAQPRFYSLLFATFALVALVLAAVGIFGVMSYAVSQSTHEIGIRMALGAQREGIIGMVLQQGMAVSALGVVVGLAGAFGLPRFLEALLFGVTATDPVTFIAVSVVFLAVALAACYLPARRATKVDPMVALRYE
jgi:putative ABC transport system permease protein